MAKTFENFAEALAWHEPLPLPQARILFPHYRLRPMLEMDLEKIQEIEKQAYEFPWSRKQFEDCLSVGYCCWICEDQKTLRGYGILSVGAGECHVLNVCVVPESQGKGLGRYLMTHLLYLGRRHHADTIFLEVRSSNLVAIRLYQNLGFNEIGIRRAYYPSRKGREDAILFARHL